jgi:hypothetical protein
MQRVIMLALGLVALAACGDTSAQRGNMVGTSAAPAASDPITNAGQSDSPATGSASNTASGSRATPSR